MRFHTFFDLRRPVLIDGRSGYYFLFGALEDSPHCTIYTSTFRLPVLETHGSANMCSFLLKTQMYLELWDLDISLSFALQKSQM